MVVADCPEQMRLLQPGKPSESITLKRRVCRVLPTAYPTRDLGPTTEEDISDWNMQGDSDQNMWYNIVEWFTWRPGLQHTQAGESATHFVTVSLEPRMMQ
jgi:hypothetical protein